MHNQNISDEYLNSFIDNQLEPDEKIQAFDAIRQNENMKEKVCEMRGLKEVIQHAYKTPPAYNRPSIEKQRTWSKHAQALAACLLLFLGGVSGWLTHDWSSRERNQEMAALQETAQLGDNIPVARKVIVHVSQSNPMKLKAALDETEGLLETYLHSNLPIRVELIANKQAVNLLRSKVSVYERRISQMQQKYPNLNFLVCGKTIGKLQNQGENVQLLPHIGIATSAADQINKRMHEGWGYVRI